MPKPVFPSRFRACALIALLLACGPAPRPGDEPGEAPTGPDAAALSTDGAGPPSVADRGAAGARGGGGGAGGSVPGDTAPNVDAAPRARDTAGPTPDGTSAPAPAATPGTPATCAHDAMLMSHKITRILTTEGNTRCLEAPSSAAGGPVQEGACGATSSAQRFMVMLRQDDCTFQIATGASNYALCIDAAGAAGETLRQQTCNAGLRAQRWELSRNPDGSYRARAGDAPPRRFWFPDALPKDPLSRMTSSGATLKAGGPDMETVFSVADASVGGMALIGDGTQQRWGDLRPGGYLEWSFSPSRAGPYLFAVTYSTPLAGAGIDLLVNGTKVGGAVLVPTETLTRKARVVVSAMLSGSGRVRIATQAAAVPYGVWELFSLHPGMHLPKAGTALPVSATAPTEVDVLAIYNMHRTTIDPNRKPLAWGGDKVFRFVEYALAVERAGRYELVLTYGTSHDTAGALVLLNPESKFAGNLVVPYAPDNVVAKIPLPRAAPGQGKSAPVALDLPAGFTRLRIRTDHNPGGVPYDLSGLTLTPRAASR